MNKLVFCGPSGAGKGTLIARLLAENPERFQTSISHTTRAPRPGEVDGISYHFVTNEAFLAMKDAFTDPIELYGNRYGTLREHPAGGKKVVYERDSRGVVVMSELPGVLVVYVKPPSLTVLEQRLRARGTETDAQITDRLATAATEMAYLDTSPLVNITLCNDYLENAYTELTLKMNDYISA